MRARGLIVAGLRSITASVNDAQLLRSAHLLCSSRGAFNARRDIRVSGMFRRGDRTTKPHQQFDAPGNAIVGI
jgi:hypothetical protein